MDKAISSGTATCDRAGSPVSSAANSVTVGSCPRPTAVLQEGAAEGRVQWTAPNHSPAPLTACFSKTGNCMADSSPLTCNTALGAGSLPSAQSQEEP